jgi:archaellum component FlaC
MTTPLFIGTLLYDNRQYSRVVPKAVVMDDAWTQPKDWSSLLPTEGKVYAPRKPSEIAVGEIFAFEVVESQNPERGADQFHLANYFAPEELLDMRHLRTEEARRKLVETGVKRSGKVEDVVVALAGDRCVRLKLKPAPDGVRSVADVEGLEALAVYELSPESFKNSRVDKQHFVIPNVTVGREIGVLDWSLDVDFLERVLRRLRKVASAGTLGQNFPQSRSQVRSVIAALQRADLLPGSGEDLQGMRERLEDFSGQLPKNIKNLEETAKAIAAMSGMTERLARLEVSERARIETEVRGNVERELRQRIERESGGLDKQLERLRSEVETASREAEEVRHEVETLRSGKAVLKAELDGTIARLRETLSGPESDRSSSQAELASELEKAMAGKGVGVDLSSATDAPWTWHSIDIAAAPVSWEDFPDRLRAVAGQFGFGTAELDVADKVARAGRMLVLPQQVAHEFVWCYATAIAAGTFSLQALDPSVVGLSDIWREPGSGRLTPFARSWRRALAIPSRFHLVLFDGLDWTPMDLWLPSFAKILDAPDRPRNLVVMGSLSARTIDPARHVSEPCWSFVPYSPRSSENPRGVHIAQAMGRTIESRWLDASTGSENSRDRAMAFVSALGSLPTADARSFALRLASTMDEPELAVRICQALAGESPSGEDVAAVIAGREWYEKLQ